MRPRKPNAADRTVDMFTCSTNVEAAEQSDVEETVKPSETIEEAAERWRANAFYTQMLVSKHFASSEYDGGRYRLTTSSKLPGYFLLERFYGEPGRSAKWTGLMFPIGDLEELAGVLVNAWRKENGGK